MTTAAKVNIPSFAELDASAQSAMTSLNTAMNNWNYNVIGAVSANSITNAIASGAGGILAKYTKSVVAPQLPVVPALPTGADDIIPMGTYTAATQQAFDAIVSPGLTLDSGPDLAAGTSMMWNETFWNNLKANLIAVTDSITNSASVLDAVAVLSDETQVMQKALYAKDYERRTQTLRDLYSAADAATGARGFSYPNSMTTALKMDAQQKFQFDMSETARHITTAVFEWAKSSLQFSIQQSVAAHNADIEFNTKYLNVSVEAFRATASAVIDQYRADLSQLVGKAELRIKEYVEQFKVKVEHMKALKEEQLKIASFDLEVTKQNAAIGKEELEAQIHALSVQCQNVLNGVQETFKQYDINAKNRIEAAKAVTQAVASLASTASNISINSGTAA